MLTKSPLRNSPLVLPIEPTPLSPSGLPWDASSGTPKLWEVDILGATTRFYLHSALAAPSGVAPAFDAAWTDSNEGSRFSMTTSHTVDAMADGTSIDWTAGAVAVDRQYISAPIKGGTINGTCKCQIRGVEGAGSDQAFYQLGLRVVSNDGSVVRGTLLTVGNRGSGLELRAPAGGGLQNRVVSDAGDAFTEVVALDGDRIVLEIGYTDTAGTTPDALSRWGSTAASDLPENDTDATDLRPWFQLTVT